MAPTYNAVRTATGKKAQAAAALQEALAAAEAQVRPPSQPPSVNGPRATLIVCPLSVLSNWQMQLEEHTAGNLKVFSPRDVTSHAALVISHGM